MIDLAAIEFRLDELERRLANVVRDGVIADADYDNALVRVQYATDDSGAPVLTSWLHWLTRRAGSAVEWWAPEMGEQVTILSSSGDLTQGVVLPALYSTAHPAPSADPKIRRTNYGDGSFVEYDENSHTMTVTVNGGDTVLNITGNLDAVIGGDADVSAGGDINADATNIRLNGGAGVVTGECICHLTGKPHGDVSSTVTAGKG